MLTFKHPVKMTLNVNLNLATKHLLKLQQNKKNSMEHIQKLLDKSDDMLHAEMTRTQSLIEDIKNLHVKYEELESSHETLSTSH